MRIGIVSLLWLPRHGGAMIYAHRLAEGLIARGHEVRVATGTPAGGGGSDGSIPADRTSEPVAADDPEACRAWYARLAPWLARHRFSHLLVNAPLSRPTDDHPRELFEAAREAGSRVGAIHYDIGRRIGARLSWAYAMTGSWEEAAARAGDEAREHLAEVGERQGYRDLDSPLYFDPDFVLSCSRWTDRFVDPLDRCPRAVLRPPIGRELLASAPDAGASPVDLAPVDVAFVNPLPHKGLECLLGVIRDGPPEWTFRVLRGGYGDGLVRLQERLGDGEALRSGRVRTLAFCPDMRRFYERSGLVLFPSLYEGYGLAAVEPLFCDTPVVARAYPSILEGVGDGAATVPYTAGVESWISAIAEVLGRRAEWVERGRRRATLLAARQERELDDLEAFLEAL